MSDEKFEIHDRYSALGIPRPDPATVCRGRCEGVGWFPVNGPDTWRQKLSRWWLNTVRGRRITKSAPRYAADSPEMAGWRAAEKESPTWDGWHFVKCDACGGTGKRSGGA